MLYLMHINTDDDCDIEYNGVRYSSRIEVIVNGETMEELQYKILQFLLKLTVIMGRTHSEDMARVLKRTIEYFNYNVLENVQYYYGGNRFIEINEYDRPIEI